MHNINENIELLNQGTLELNYCKAQPSFSSAQLKLSLVLVPVFYSHPPPGKVSDKLNLHGIDLKCKAKLLNMLC